VKQLWTYITILVLLTLPVSAFAEKYFLPIAASEGLAASYNHFLAKRDNDPCNIHDYSGTSRSVISLILMQQAADIGGLPFSPLFRKAPNPGRALLQVKQGKAVAFAGDMWRCEADDTMIISPPVVRKGEFEKGIYGKKENRRLMTVRSLKDLQKLSTAVDLTWTQDIDVLQKMHIGSIIKVPRYSLMLRLVDSGRVDFILGELGGSTKDLSFQHYDITLYPVPGVKIALNDSRHFLFSKQHPMGKRLAQAVTRGMTVLRKRGTIRRALEQCGFINKNVHHWKRLYPENTSAIDSGPASR